MQCRDSHIPSLFANHIVQSHPLCFVHCDRKTWNQRESAFLDKLLTEETSAHSLYCGWLPFSSGPFLIECYHDFSFHKCYVGEFLQPKFMLSFGICIFASMRRHQFNIDTQRWLGQSNQGFVSQTKRQTCHFLLLLQIAGGQ